MLGEKIRIIRKEMGLTQLQFSKMLNISRSNLRDLEIGKNKGGNIKLINKLCEITNKDISFFLDEKSNIKIKQYELLDSTIDMLIDKGLVDDNGKIDDSCKNIVLEMVEREIAIKIERKNSK